MNTQTHIDMRTCLMRKRHDMSEMTLLMLMITKSVSWFVYLKINISVKVNSLIYFDWKLFSYIIDCTERMAATGRFINQVLVHVKMTY